MGVGYTFIRDRWGVSPQINYGILKRFNRGFSSFDIGTDISYKLSPKLKLSILGTFTQRNDLAYRWGITNVFRFNGYAGIKYIIK